MLTGADLRERDPTDFVWHLRLSSSGEGTVVVALMSPCCVAGISMHITMATARAMPRLRLDQIRFEHLVCVTCDAMLPLTPNVERLQTRYRANTSIMPCLENWAEACLRLNPLEASLWADSAMTTVREWASTEGWTTVLIPIVDSKPS